MSSEQIVQREAALRRRQAIIAALAGVLFLLAGGLQLTGPTSKVGELTVQLITINKRNPLDAISGAVQLLALLALAWTLSFLFDAARARRPEMAPGTRIAMIAGAAASGVASLVYSIFLSIKAHDFVTHGNQTYPEAHQLTGGAALPVVQTLDIVAQFALEISLILISLNAMRTGLLTRFMGYTGVVVGIAGMLLIGSPPAAILQVFWVLALAVLFAGRWPGAEPPAWSRGEAVPWPSTAQMREQRMRVAGGRGRGGAPPQPAPSTAGAGGGSTARASSGRQQGSAAKRKRKRKR